MYMSRYTEQGLRDIFFDALDFFNEALDSGITRDNTVLAFFTPENGLDVYEQFCRERFPKNLDEDYEAEGYFQSFAAQAFVGKGRYGVMMCADIDFRLPELHRVFLHEISHLACYLSHAWNGEENAAGAVFLDYRADACLGDFNTLIYGHRMRNGAMFGSLKHYKDADFWRENPSVYLANENGTWRYDIYAAYETGLTAATYQREFSEPEEKQDFIRCGLERSVIDTGVTPTPEDTVITLSTCSGGDRNTRWVVQAVSGK